MRTPVALIAALSLTACGVRTSPATLLDPPPIDTIAIREHTRVLADDSMGGRGTGTPGSRAAARYIASELHELGLRPLDRRSGNEAADYLLPVPLLRVDVSAATLAVGDSDPVSNGAGYVVGRIGREGMRAASGPVHALGADSAAVPSGAWVLIDGPLGEAAGRWLPAWRERGAVGVLVRLASDAMVAGYHSQLGPVRWQLREGPPDPVWQPDLPVLMVGPALAGTMARGTRVSFDPHARVEDVVEHNVAGVLAGAAGDRAPLVLTAHYDHLGIARGLRGDSIFNGFSDNAAGVAMLLAIARSARAAPPPRPFVFLFPTAEEVGLLGSIHFVRTHASLVERTHAAVNLDAGAPPAPPTRWRLAAGTRSAAGPVAAAVVEESGWTHRSDPGSPNSDHWPFVAAGVPAIFLIPDGAFEGVDEEGTRRLLARWDRYHQPGDEWAPDFPFAGLARYAWLGLRIAYALAAAELPR